MRNKGGWTAARWAAAGLIGFALCAEALAAREPKTRAAPEAGDLEARRLFGKAQELLQMRETERGVAMLEAILEQYPSSDVVYEALLALGKHHLTARDQAKAIQYLTRLKALEQQEDLTDAERDVLIEGLYLMGVAYFQMRQYAAAFPILRKITNEYPDTVWANQAYYYIGMCHFAQQNWNKAIEALSLVGTFVDPDSPTTQYVEAGRRFYLKIQDADLPVLARLGRKVTAVLETTRGDRETVECVPMSARGDTFLGSIVTEIALPKPGDQVLQVVGGDAIQVRYVDENAEDGSSQVPREARVRVVSSASLSFTLGDLETPATAAFLDQPLFVLLQDADGDVSDGPDSVQVRVTSWRRAEEGEDSEDGAEKVAVSRLLASGEEERRVVRDQVVLTLAERGQPPVHSGRFGGAVRIEAPRPDRPVNPADDVLTCDRDDTVEVSFTDERHIEGESPRVVTASLPVVSEIDNRPKATQDVVADAVIRSKKYLVEASAYLELARIFKSMGLVKGARQKAQEGLERVDSVVRTTTPIPSPIKQEAFRLKWELHLASDDFGSAMATCHLFNRLYPNSPFVDQALLGMAKIRTENKEYTEAIKVYRQILNLPRSEAKAEAQFGIAQATEALRGATNEVTIQEYKLCAERYPDSPFAGPSLAKVVDYHVERQNYAQAQAILEQIFQDYPDAPFLDNMLLKWVLVSYRTGDFQKAYEQCSRLIFEYPASPYAGKAREILPRIEARLKGGAPGG